MKIIGTKPAVEPFNIISVNEDVKIDYKENGPGMVLEDDSILVFDSVDALNYFTLESGMVFHNLIDMVQLEESMYMEDDLPMNKYTYYNKYLTAVTIYQLNKKYRVIRLFREDLP